MNDGPTQVATISPGRIDVTGPLTFQTARRVYNAGIACLLSDSDPAVIMDCSQVSGADSAGLSVLIEWRRWAHQQHRHLRFANLPAQISAIAQLSEVSTLLADAVA